VVAAEILEPPHRVKRVVVVESLEIFKSH